MDPTQLPQNPAPEQPSPQYLPQPQPMAVPLPPQPQAYAAQQVPVPAYVQPTPAQKRSKKPLIMIIVGLILIIGGLIAFVLIIISIVNSATNEAVMVSNRFVADVQANKPGEAYALTAPGFQQVSSEDDLTKVITESGPSLRGTTKVTSKSAITKGTSKLAVIDYSIANGKTHKYMQIILQRNDDAWQVYTFRARDTPYIGTEGSGVVD